MVKRIVALVLGILILCCAGMLVACNSVAEDEPQQLNPDIPDGVLGFETVFACYETGMIGGKQDDDLYESRVRMYYLRERLTNTMYIWRTSGRDDGINGYSHWSSGMTVLMDPSTNGPMTYEAFLQYIQDMRTVCQKCNREFTEPVSYCPDCGSALNIQEE